jgi:hypothetical protein
MTTAICIRTQGNRIASLTEVLMCISCQEVPPDEIFICAHKCNDDSFSELAELVLWCRAVLRINPQLVRVDWGQRGSPINASISASKSSLIAIVDDDDIILPSYVRLFSESHIQNPSSILRMKTYGRYQKLLSENQRYSLSTVFPIYSKSFQISQTMLQNQTPLIGFAFPLRPLKTNSLYFSEELVVLEDWDFILRCASILPLVEIEQYGCVYNLDWNRRLSNENKAIWKASRNQVLTNVNSESFRSKVQSGDTRRFLRYKQVFQSQFALFLSLTYKLFHPLIKRIVPPGGVIYRMFLRLFQT